MASPARDKFIIEAHRLAHAAPQVWKEFEAAFAVYVAHQVEEAVRAPAMNALAAHGVAQAYLTLRDDFQKLEQLYSLVEHKLSSKQPR